MTRLQELTLRLADDTLPDDEWHELERLLATEPEAVATHLQLLKLEASLRGLRETLDLAGPTVARLHSGLAASVKRDVMERLRAWPQPAWARARTNTPSPGNSRWLERLGFCVRRWPPTQTAMLAFAASILVFLSLSAWFFGSPTMGQPVLAEVKGQGSSIERATEVVPALNGTRLQPGDVLHLGTNASATIAFGAEKTRLELAAGAELNVTSFAYGKHFGLEAGRIEASVAHQRPFKSMVITTPQAEVRVLGTRFSLNATSNATRLEVAEGKVRFTRTRDRQAVRVAGGSYAVAAADYELAALPFTGKILREFWRGVSVTSLRAFEQDPRFPAHPDGWDLSSAFELEPTETNHLVVRFSGYLHPPITGDYEFWLAGASAAQLFLSPAERAEERIVIAQTSDGTRAKAWDAPRFQRQSQWAPPLPLVAGRRYYIEGLVLVQHGEGHLSVAWKGPGRPRELLTAEFLSPAEPKK